MENAVKPIYDLCSESVQWLCRWALQWFDTCRTTRSWTQRQVLEDLPVSHGSLHFKLRDYFTQDGWKPKCRRRRLRRREINPLPPPPSADETAQFSHIFVTINNMKFPDSVAKAFNKKPKKIGYRTCCCRRRPLVCCPVFISCCHHSPRTFVRYICFVCLFVCLFASLCLFMSSASLHLYTWLHNYCRILSAWSHEEQIEVGGACGTCGAEERCIQGFGGETWGQETYEWMEG